MTGAAQGPEIRLQAPGKDARELPDFDFPDRDHGRRKKNSPPGLPAASLATLSLVALLFLRFPLLFASGIIGSFHDTAYAVFVTGTYLFTAVYIGAKRGELDGLHITRGFLAVWMLLPLLALLLRQAAGGGYVVSWAMPLIAVAMFFLPAEERPRFLKIAPMKSAVWLGASLVSGIVGGMVMGLLLRLQMPGLPARPFSLGLFGSALLAQLVTAGLCEEPLFRGFLPAWLQKEKGYSPMAACLTQAALFTLAHSDYLAAGLYLSFAAAFLMGLLLGLLSLKSRSLACPLLTHALINAVADMVRLGSF
jgi:membrane protease YdiL (CAAX protease family)